jgi:hypothetical protein
MGAAWAHGLALTTVLRKETVLVRRWESQMEPATARVSGKALGGRMVLALGRGKVGESG